jgi:hypothetical protein
LNPGATRGERLVSSWMMALRWLVVAGVMALWSWGSSTDSAKTAQSPRQIRIETAEMQGTRPGLCQDCKN